MTSAPPLRTARTPALDVAYEQTGPDDGTPVVLLHGFPYDVALRRTLAGAFAAVRARVAAAFAGAGWDRAEAEGVAALVVAAYEGGLLQARAAGSVEPMAQATGALIALLRAGATPVGARRGR